MSSTDIFLSKIYEIYLERKQNSNAETPINLFKINDISTIFPDISRNTLSREKYNLKSMGLIDLYVDGSFVLNDNGITYSEKYLS